MLDNKPLFVVSGHSYLEKGELDKPVDSFCEIAQVRAKALKKSYAYKQNSKS